MGVPARLGAGIHPSLLVVSPSRAKLSGQAPHRSADAAARIGDRRPSRRSRMRFWTPGGYRRSRFECVGHGNCAAFIAEAMIGFELWKAASCAELLTEPEPGGHGVGDHEWGDDLGDICGGTAALWESEGKGPRGRLRGWRPRSNAKLELRSPARYA